MERTSWRPSSTFLVTAFTCVCLILASLTASSLHSTAQDVGELTILLENEIEMSERIQTWEDAACATQTVHTRQRVGESDQDFKDRHKADYREVEEEYGTKAQ